MKKIFTSVLLIVLCGKVNATIYTVNLTTDVTGNSSNRTLRYCITQANSNVGKDTIDFALTGGGPYTIAIGSNLPVVSDPLVIRGFSQSGSVQGQLGTGARVMQVILNGPGNNTVYGLQFTASNCEISGLVIQNFYVGIYLNGSDNSWIWGNYIGTNNTGLSVSATTTCYDDGIRLNNNANNNFIGTNGDGSNDANEGNCIGGNGDGGTQYLGECIAVNEGGLIGANCTGNRIAGNYLGINESGTAALYTISTVNTQRGSGIHITNSTANIIGTNADGVSDVLERNVISGNSDAGVVLQGSSTCKVKGNYIGTDKTGLIGVPNYSNGGTSVATTQIAIKSTSSNNYIGTDGDGIRDDIEGNIIGSATITAGGATSYSDGIDVAGTNNHVSGNYIGIGSDGTTAISILTTGIAVNDYAIYVTGANNIIGTNGDGISDVYEQNYIGNSGSGIVFEGVSGCTAAGNYIGLGSNKTTSEALGYAGIYIIQSGTCRVGSSALNTNEMNYICNSSQYGIWIDDLTVKVTDFLNIRYNTIGQRPDNTPAPNAKHGIYLVGESDADTIQYNIITRNGTASSTGAYAGVRIGETYASGESRHDYIYKNTIFKNIGAGIEIVNSISFDNKITQNSIYNNGNASDATGKYKLGIDLNANGLTLNDTKDPDTGPNGLSNFPIITAAIKGGTSCTQNISGTFNGLANTQYYIEIFSSDVCNGDTSGVDYFSNASYKYGEGKTYEGTTSVFTTDGSGNANWTSTVSITGSTGQYLTAVAIQNTASLYNTSEFSMCYDIRSDFGDAPDSYHTLAANCGPIHVNTNTNLIIGSTVTTEDDGQPSAAANLDSDDAISSFPTLTNKSTSYTLSNIPVTNSTGSTATLYAWIDFNRNGAFEIGEYASASVANGATTATLTWDLASFSCEGTLKSGISYLRMRLTTDALTDNAGTTSEDERCYGIANNGEVEDYKIYIQGYDYGDLSASYPVASALCLEDTATAKVWAGITQPSTECTQKYSVDASGDGVEEDGLTTSIGPSGASYNWVIRLNANQAAKTVYYGLWCDWDGNTTFTTIAPDAFYSSSASVTGVTTQNVSVYSPYGITGNSSFRLIVSDAPVTSGMYNATFTNGEVEDYILYKILASSSNILIGMKQLNTNILKWKNTAALYVVDNIRFCIPHTRQ
jgi:parallel beta-helix repeat protein